jgi:hypothetical protein
MSNCHIPERKEILSLPARQDCSVKTCLSRSETVGGFPQVRRPAVMLYSGLRASRPYLFLEPTCCVCVVVGLSPGHHAGGVGIVRDGRWSPAGAEFRVRPPLAVFSTEAKRSREISPQLLTLAFGYWNENPPLRSEGRRNRKRGQGGLRCCVDRQNYSSPFIRLCHLPE